MSRTHPTPLHNIIATGIGAACTVGGTHPFVNPFVRFFVGGHVGSFDDPFVGFFVDGLIGPFVGPFVGFFEGSDNFWHS